MQEFIIVISKQRKVGLNEGLAAEMSRAGVSAIDFQYGVLG